MSSNKGERCTFLCSHCGKGPTFISINREVAAVKLRAAGWIVLLGECRCPDCESIDLAARLLKATEHASRLGKTMRAPRTQAAASPAQEKALVEALRASVDRRPA